MPRSINTISRCISRHPVIVHLRSAFPDTAGGCRYGLQLPGVLQYRLCGTLSASALAEAAPALSCCRLAAVQSGLVESRVEAGFLLRPSQNMQQERAHKSETDFELLVSDLTRRARMAFLRYGLLSGWLAMRFSPRHFPFPDFFYI